MRLTQNQVSCVIENMHKFFGRDSHVWLFGSRCDDQKKGGDIDLYVQTKLDDEDIIPAKMKFLAAMYKQFGEQKIDLVIHQTEKIQELPIYEHAQRTGIKLL